VFGGGGLGFGSGVDWAWDLGIVGSGPLILVDGRGMACMCLCLSARGDRCIELSDHQRPFPFNPPRQGMSYVLDVMKPEEVTAEDHVEAYEQHGFSCVVDPQSMLYLFGLQLDYKDALIGGGFQFMVRACVRACVRVCVYMHVGGGGGGYCCLECFSEPFHSFVLSMTQWLLCCSWNAPLPLAQSCTHLQNPNSAETCGCGKSFGI
jgi:Fe-S cluster assembly iron-binding protein IscA